MVRTRLLFAAGAALTVLAHGPCARANGRMPGATSLTLSRDDPDHVIVSATYGLVQTFDGGQTFEWICEQGLGVNGEADLPTAVTTNGRLVLIPPVGGALVSSDRGCSFTPAPAPLAGTRTVDLASDPGDAARVVVLSSTVASITDTGLVSYTNQVVETRDGAATWAVLADLPSDLSAETLEVAPTDPSRLYVSGTASDDPLLGVVLRSEDGGATWTRATLTLPAGSGSVFIGGVHPSNPDRLWVRVPARGDVGGLFATSLFESADQGATWSPLASTTRGMFGFAVSPDGAWIAYGGPYDGVFVGPSDGTGFTQVNAAGVRCLRWNEDGLYACGLQPGGPFTLGVSADRGATFRPFFDSAQICPRTCDDGGTLRETCEPAWAALSPLLGASGESCATKWGGTTDAGGSGGGSASDASTPGGAPALEAEAGAAGSSTGAGAAAAADGCGCRIGGEGAAPRSGPGMLIAIVMATSLRRARRDGARRCFYGISSTLRKLPAVFQPARH